MDGKIKDILNRSYEENKKKIEELDNEYSFIGNEFWQPRWRHFREFLFTIGSLFSLMLLVVGIKVFTSIDVYVNVQNTFIMFLTSLVLGIKIDKELEAINRNDKDFFRKQIEIEIEEIKLIQRNKVIKRLLNNNQNKSTISNKNLDSNASLDELYNKLDILITKLVLKKQISTFDDIISNSSVYSLLFILLGNLYSCFGSFINYDVFLLLDSDITLKCLCYGIFYGLYYECMEFKNTKKIIDGINGEFFVNDECRRLDCSKKDYRRLIRKCVNEIVVKENIELEKKENMEHVVNIVLSEESKKNVNQEIKRTFMTRIAPKMVDYEFRRSPEVMRNVKVRRKVLEKEEI